jgi:hypothetical protein
MQWDDKVKREQPGLPEIVLYQTKIYIPRFPSFRTWAGTGGGEAFSGAHA